MPPVIGTVPRTRCCVPPERQNVTPAWCTRQHVTFPVFLVFTHVQHYQGLTSHQALAFRLHIKVSGNMHMTPNRKLKFILAVLSILLLATAALARERKLSSELNQHLAKLNAAATPEEASQKAAEMVDVIIQFRKGA